jgi:hypothetical protein
MSQKVKCTTGCFVETPNIEIWNLVQKYFSYSILWYGFYKPYSVNVSVSSDDDKAHR